MATLTRNQVTADHSLHHLRGIDGLFSVRQSGDTLATFNDLNQAENYAATIEFTHIKDRPTIGYRSYSEGPAWTVTTEGDPNNPANLYPFAIRERGVIRDCHSVLFIAQGLADRNNAPVGDGHTYIEAIRGQAIQFIAQHGREVADADEWADAEVMREVSRIVRETKADPIPATPEEIEYREAVQLAKRSAETLDLDVLASLADLPDMPHHTPRERGYHAGFSLAYQQRTEQPNDPGYYPNHS